MTVDCGYISNMFPPSGPSGVPPLLKKRFTSLYVLEYRNYYPSSKNMDNVVVGLFTTKEKLIAFIKDNLDYGGSEPYWWFANKEVINPKSHAHSLPSSILIFDRYGNELKEQPGPFDFIYKTKQ